MAKEKRDRVVCFTTTEAQYQQLQELSKESSVSALLRSIINLYLQATQQSNQQDNAA